MKSFLFNLIFITSSLLHGQVPFITTWKTDNPGASCNTCIHIPAHPNSNYDVDWNNDGVYDDFGVTGPITHNYLVPGIYTVAIKGTFPQIHFNGTGDNQKIISINQWGDIQWSTMVRAFEGCSNLVGLASDAPDLSNVTNMYRMFFNCVNFNQDLNNWNMSNITRTEQMFFGCTSFNGNISSWDLSSVTIMSNMFFNCINFNQDISNWTISSCTDMHQMFWNNNSFNQDLSNWDVSSVTDIRAMFAGCDIFNSDLSNWNVSNVTNMEGVFFDCVNFNNNISTWNVSNVTNMSLMFAGASNFDQDLSWWNVGNVLNFNDFLDNSGLSLLNYDKLLIEWSILPNIQSNLNFGAEGLAYCNGNAARNNLITNKGWNFTGDNLNCLINCIHPDYNALMDLYYSTNGAYWFNNTGWEDGSQGLNCNPCSWYGVTCNGSNRVIKLELFNNGLTGIIPPAIGDITFLDLLYLYSNQIVGQLPVEIGQLSNLVNLSINSTLLSGPIPSTIGNLDNLLFLSLSNNNLSGTLPIELGDMDNLLSLSIWDNQFTGNIPPQIGELNTLLHLSMSNNQFSGNIPSSIGNLTNLDYLRLDNNLLTGSIPPELGNLTHVTQFWLANNQLSGNIPSELGNLTTVIEFQLQNNLLSGCIPIDLQSICPNVQFGNINGNSGLSSQSWTNFCANGEGSCIDNCMDFDGINDELHRSGLSTNGNFTVMAWFKADVVSNGGAEDRIFSFGPTTRLEIGIDHTTGNLWVHDAQYGNYNTINFVRDGNWHHVAFTRNGTQRNIFLDGALVGTYTASTANYTPNFRVGNWTGGGTAALFKGQIDEVAFWNYPMTSSDIQSIACNITGVESGLIAFYDFNLGVSGADNTFINSIPDLSGNGNDLTINNIAMNGAGSNLLISGAGINSACATCFVLPTQGVISGAQTICLSGNPTAINNTTSGTVSGGAAISYRWESSVSPFSTWNTIGGATGLTYDPPSGITETTHYRRVTIGTLNSTSCESSSTNVVIVTVQNTPTPGAISGDQTICSGADPAQIDNATVGGVSGVATLSYRWESSISPFSTWNTINGANAETYDPPAGLAETTHYRRITVGTLNTVSCESAPSNVVIVNVQNALPVALCNTNLTYNLLPSEGTITVNVLQINDGSYATCGNIASISFHPTNLVTSLTYNCTQLGVKNEVLYVTDDNGMQSSCTTTFTVDVNDPSFQALREFYNATGGPGWTNTIANDRPWFQDCDPCGLIDGIPWFGLTCNIYSTLDNILIKQFFVNNNNLNGTLPDVFNAFDVIEWFLVNNNPNLTGAIPSSFCSMTTLIIINLSNTGIGMDAPSPTFPTNCFANFDELGQLNAWHNTMGHFSGPLPEINPDAPINTLLFNNNNFSGSIPESYGQINLPSAGIFRFHNNPLITGCYPLSMNNHCHLSEFTNANISNNTGLPPWSDFCATQSNACCQEVGDLIINWSPIVSGSYSATGNVQIIHPNPVIAPNAAVIFAHGVGSSVTMPNSLNTQVGNNIQIQLNGCN